jgi:hypothetical protein
MLDLGSGHHQYLSSALLSKHIKNFHEQATSLVPFLQKCKGFHEIDTQQSFDNAFGQLSDILNPTLVLIRAGINSNELRT